MRPRLAITPICPQYQHGRMAWAKPTEESNEEPHIAQKRRTWPKKTPSETPPATRYPIKTCTCTIFLKIGSYLRSQGRFPPRVYFLLGPRSFPGECSMVTRLTTSTPTEMRPSLKEHHGSLAFPPFCTSFLTRRILWCAFAASPPLPRTFPSHPCHFLVVFDFLSCGLH